MLGAGVAKGQGAFSLSNIHQAEKEKEWER